MHTIVHYFSSADLFVKIHAVFTGIILIFQHKYFIDSLALYVCELTGLSFFTMYQNNYQVVLESSYTLVVLERTPAVDSKCFDLTNKAVFVLGACLFLQDYNLTLQPTYVCKPQQYAYYTCYCQFYIIAVSIIQRRSVISKGGSILSFFFPYKSFKEKKNC